MNNFIDKDDLIRFLTNPIQKLITDKHSPLPDCMNQHALLKYRSVFRDMVYNQFNEFLESDNVTVDYYTNLGGRHYDTPYLVCNIPDLNNQFVGSGFTENNVSGPLDTIVIVSGGTRQGFHAFAESRSKIDFKIEKGFLTFNRRFS